MSMSIMQEQALYAIRLLYNEEPQDRDSAVAQRRRLRAARDLSQLITDLDIEENDMAIRLYGTKRSE